eukprot:gene5948-9777_t
MFRRLKLKPNQFSKFYSVALKPVETVNELDRNIVGQKDAKKAVAIALRNRWRRKQLSQELMNEILPKNILMVGPTGIGKTEISRRLAKLTDSPFIKVEATKYTEIGYVGGNVEQIIKDLVNIAIQQTKEKKKKNYEKEAESVVNEKIIEILMNTKDKQTVEEYKELLQNGELEEFQIEISVPEVKRMPQNEMIPEVILDALQHARNVIRDAEVEKLVDMSTVEREAIELVEEEAIVFIDEIDKICTKYKESSSSLNPSSEGVQRDLLPIIEGTTVNTQFGMVKTNHILFICSGAFHKVKPSDMLPELQGRLPIRVELQGLSKDDLYRILTEPEANLLKQNIELFKTEGCDLSFTKEAIEEIARISFEINSTIENTGARRLYTVVEKIIEDYSFNADELEKIEITKEIVNEKVGSLLNKIDLKQFIL